MELGNGKQPKADATLNNGLKDVPARLLTPIEVNKENIDATVIKDGFHKIHDSGKLECDPRFGCGGGVGVGRRGYGFPGNN